MTDEGLKDLFNPHSIAVIGATDTPKKVGLALMESLISGGFTGRIYPVNPHRASVCGLSAYTSVEKINAPVDLAIIATSAATVPGIVEECAKAGIKSLIIISSGFKESGKEGEKLYEQISKSSKEHNLTILGPNCLGLIRPSISLNASFIKQIPAVGRVAFISQSGALGSAILDWSIKEGLGFSSFISVGETADVDFSDLLNYLTKDQETEGVLIYMESLSRAQKFLEAARNCSLAKPIVVLKAGKNEAGSKAAFSHTGSLAGNDTAFDTAFRRSGVLRVQTIREFFNCAKLISTGKIGDVRLAVVTNAGGPGVVAADYVIENHGKMAELSPKTLKELEKLLGPIFWSRANPVDVLGDAGPEKISGAVEICLEDEQVDGVLMIVTPQAMTEPTAVARNIIDIKKKTGKPILSVFLGGGLVETACQVLKREGLPVYDFPEEAIASFFNLYHYSTGLKIIKDAPLKINKTDNPKKAENKKIIEGVYRSGRLILNPVEVTSFLNNYDIPANESFLVKTPEEAAEAGLKIGFPVVLKIDSKDVSHKTEVGGIILNVDGAEKASEAFKEIISRVKKAVPEAAIEGVTISRFEARRYELFMGMKKDALFGPLIAFGRGGVEVEAIKDIAVELAPLNEMLAKMLIERTQISKLLKGWRGQLGVNLLQLEEVLCNLSRLVEDFPEIAELDLNPFAVDERSGLVLDARILLEPIKS